MISTPVFKYHFHVEISKTEDVVYLLSESGHHCLRGYVYRLLAPLIDGVHSVNEIVETLQLFVSETSIREAFSRLESRGFVIEAGLKLPTPGASFWSIHGIDAEITEITFRQKSVSVQSFGDVRKETFIKILQSLGIRESDESDLLVVLTDDYLQENLKEINNRQLDNAQPWMLVKPVGKSLWIGPLFIPRETGCWRCLSHRLVENRKVETFLQQYRGIAAPFPVSKSVLPSTLETGLSLAATQVALYLANPSTSALINTVNTIDTATLQTRRHILTKRPQCVSCGNRESTSFKELKIQSRKKVFTEDGGHRICSPSETLQQFGHLISPITGVVGELIPMFSDTNRLVNIFCGTYRTSVHINGFDALQNSLRSNSTGKGKGEIQSRASAFSEAVERYCAVYLGTEKRFRRSLAQMDDTAIPIEDCMLFSDRQYRHRDEWNRNHLGLDYVPQRLQSETSIEWTPVWSYTSQSVKHVPTAYCYLQYHDPVDRDEPFFSVDSNGLAAGNVLEEAILQGFFEVVERDAVSIWWYNRLQYPQVDLDSFHDPYFDSLRDYYFSLGREFWVLDITNDMAIPTFVSISRLVGRKQEFITMGCGTHFDVRLAVSRAITEMNQALYLLESERMTKHAVSEREQFAAQWCRKATCENQPYLAPLHGKAARCLNTYSENYNEDLRDDLEQCFQITCNLGLDFLVHDLTQPDIGMSVVKVIVPGMCQIRARFAPGRLYEVPVRQGRLDRPLDESDLNPVNWWL